MKIANHDGRAVIVVEDATSADGQLSVVDVQRASAGRCGPDPGTVLQDWPRFVDWASQSPLDGVGRVTVPAEELGPPVSAPAQIFAIGLNYRDHAAETGLAVPPLPATFTKFVSCLAGPYTQLALSGDTVDWEVELVVVIGETARHVTAQHAWGHVAGVMVGQDFSDRSIQMIGAAPQFSLGKSFPGYGPTGPWLVTCDELGNPDDLELTCAVNGETVQRARTSEMVFSVPLLIEALSGVCTLRPGDLIFTGTPSGVAMGSPTRKYLAPGDEVVSSIEHVGEIRNRCVAARTSRAAAMALTDGITHLATEP
jgi:2-keto-4-pentenoate hydratase/2-oxohepta-3-ene-1,7-dioic acid hydratase in catechol pathway